MQHIPTATKKSFQVLASTASLQAATMVLKPGESTGDVHNEHPRAEQWLYVVSGTGRAATGKRRVPLKPNTLLLIEKREPHQITNTGRKPLVTLNFYAPPAYTQDGEVRPAVK